MLILKKVSEKIGKFSFHIPYSFKMNFIKQRVLLLFLNHWFIIYYCHVPFIYAKTRVMECLYPVWLFPYFSRDISTTWASATWIRTRTFLLARNRDWFCSIAEPKEKKPCVYHEHTFLSRYKSWIIIDMYVPFIKHIATKPGLLLKF